jgi:hypothetical protein
MYEDMDTLIEYARQNPSEFVTYSDMELIEIKHGDEGLEITYKTIDEYDENDNEILKTETETFDIESAQMMVTVPDISELFKSA